MQTEYRPTSNTREWLKGFALMIALIVLTLTFATVLARSGADGTIRL